MSCFVPIYAIATELWPLNRIEDGGRHLEFTSGVNFGHMAVFRMLVLIFLLMFMNVPQSSA